MTGRQRRIRIVFFIDFIKTEFAGTEGQLLRLITGLPRNRFDVMLICLQNNEWIRDNAEMFKCPVYALNVHSFRSITTYGNMVTLYRLIRRLSPDIVHTFFPISNVVGVLAAKCARVTHIVSSRRDTGQWMNPLSIFFTRMANRFVSKIVANSEQVKQVTVVREGVPAAKIDVFLNGIDLKGFDAKMTSSEGNRIKEEWSIPRRNRIVGIVANHRPMKHLHTFLEAASLLMKNRKDVTFVLVGDGLIRPQLEQLAHELGIDESVRFVGRRSDVIPYLGIFDVGVNCSEAEGLSNAVIEYMAAMVPCVVADAGGNVALVKDGVRGFVYPLDDARYLADRIMILLDDDKVKKQFVKNAREFVAQNLGMQTMVDNYTDYYARFLDEHRRSRRGVGNA